MRNDNLTVVPIARFIAPKWVRLAMALAVAIASAIIPSASPGVSAQTKASAPPLCEVRSKDEVNLACDYDAMSGDSAGAAQSQPPIAINHALVSFKVRHDNYMRLELTFTALAAPKFSEARTIYFEIDDDAGNNYIRRRLPHVDFSKLEPGTPSTFAERLLVPALEPRHYVAYLWIPDPDPALKFNASHNFLISSVGVPDRTTGLNRIATFTVDR